MMAQSKKESGREELVCFLNVNNEPLAGIGDDLANKLADGLQKRGIMVCRGELPQSERERHKRSAAVLNYRNYFTGTEIINTLPTVFVCFPNGIESSHSLFRVLRLVEDGVVNEAQIILTPSSYWQGLVNWFQESMFPYGYVKKHIIESISVLDGLEMIEGKIITFLFNNDFDSTIRETS